MGSSKPIIELDDATVCIIRPPIIVSTDVIGAQGNILIPPIGIARTGFINVLTNQPDRPLEWEFIALLKSGQAPLA